MSMAGSSSGESVVTTLNNWRKARSPGRMVKGKVDKGSEVCLFHQNGMLLVWPLAFSSSCFPALLVLVGEATAGKKKWFNPECFCQGFESGGILSFPLIIAAVFLVTHNISWLLFNPLEYAYGQATLTWFV
ncbi:hypothetical protein V6N13_095281 [Hibiscus sabdariffa]